MDNYSYEMKTSDLDFQVAVRSIDNMKDKFIMVMSEFGYQKNEIAYMLSVHPSTIGRHYKKACRVIFSARNINK